MRRRELRVWHHATFRVPLAPHGQATQDPSRAEDALTWALDLAVCGPDDVVPPDEISWADAALVHDRGYLERLDDPAEVARIVAVEPSQVPHGGMMELWRRACGGVLAAARWAVRTEHVGVVTIGGFHHAEPALGGGFCALNDIAIAVQRLRAEGHRGWIRIVDLDAHPPDGIVACLAADTRVEILSLSVASAWSLPPHPQVVDRRVAPGTTDEAYLNEVRRLLADAQAPATLLFYLAGGDPLAEDPLGGLMVSEAGLRTRDRWVLAAHQGVPTVCVPAGGYTEGAWRVLAGTMAEAAGLSTAVAPDYAPLARRTRHVARQLDPAVLRGDDDTWDDAELLASLGVRPPRERRFLDYYSRHGLEYALTRFGLFPALRAMGFDDLAIEISYNESGHRLCITTPFHGRREALIDLTVTRRPLGDYTLLFVEWLEMRDPRRAYGPDRPALPGQRSPGLGLAPEVGHLLFASAERLGLDGVGLVPAHFHVAWMSRHRFTVIDAEQRGQFAALCEVDLPLAELSGHLSGEGLPTRDGPPLTWTPMPMVVPVSDGMHAHLRADAEVVAAAREALRARLDVPFVDPTKNATEP